MPHGYLSEDEGVDGEEDNLTPEMRKAKQLLLQQRFEAAAMRKLQPLQNVVISPAVDPAQHPVLKQYKVRSLAVIGKIVNSTGLIFLDVHYVYIKTRF